MMRQKQRQKKKRVGTCDSGDVSEDGSAAVTAAAEAAGAARVSQAGTTARAWPYT